MSKPVKILLSVLVSVFVITAAVIGVRLFQRDSSLPVLKIGGTVSYTSTAKPLASPIRPRVENRPLPLATTDSLPLPVASELILQAFVGHDGENPNPNIALHSQVQSEAPDPSWSLNAEQQLHAHLISSIDPGRFEIVNIQCSASLCEIQAAGKFSQNADADREAWQTAMTDFWKQPWWAGDGFNQLSTMIWNAPDGRALFLYYFSRKR